MRKYKFEREMSFLIKYLTDRDKKINVTKTASVANSPKIFEDDEDDRLEDIDNQTDSEPLTPASS